MPPPMPNAGGDESPGEDDPHQDEQKIGILQAPRTEEVVNEITHGQIYDFQKVKNIPSLDGEG